MATPTKNFEPLFNKQADVKEKMSSIANVLDNTNPSAAAQLRVLRDGIDFHTKAEIAIFDPNDKCSAFSFIEQTGTLFGFDPDNYDFYSATKQTLDNIFDIANTIPLAILSELDSMLDKIEQDITLVNDILIEMNNTVDDGNDEIENTIDIINGTKDRIQKDHKKLLFVLAALALPMEDVRMYLDKAKLFEQTVLSPCQGFYQAKFLEGFMDEYGFVDVDNVLKQTDKIKVFMDSLPDSVF